MKPLKSNPAMKLLCSIPTFRLDNLSYCYLASNQHQVVSPGFSRSLLNSRPDVLLIQSSGPNQLGAALLNSTHFTDPGFQDVLSQLGVSLSLKTVRPATIDDVRHSLVVSLNARLSTRWNAVGPWLVHRQQQDFLNPEDEEISLEAVKFNTRAEGNALTFWAGCGELQMFPVRPHDLVLEEDRFRHLLEHPDAIIYFQQADHQHHRFVYLPKLSAGGRLVSISRNLPQGSPFESYYDLRSYWQQQYGYELPEEIDGQVYFNVIYPGGDRTVYTYPSCCVFQRGPEVSLPSDEMANSTLYHFRQDLIQLLKNVFPSQQIEVTQMKSPEERAQQVRQTLCWKDKLDQDLDQDAQFKSRAISNAEAGKLRISKYFPPENKKKKKTKTGTMASSKNSKITEYFSTTARPERNVTIKRKANKVFFKPISQGQLEELKPGGPFFH